jgi:ribonuclease VapC
VIVLDTSVILHVTFEEPNWESSVAFLLQDDSRLISAVSLVEAQVVLTGRTIGEPGEILDRLLLELIVEVVSFTPSQARLARTAYLRYGKGQGHGARLNYCDVMSYALAKDRQAPLAFVGDDFNQTDLQTVRLPLY